MLQFYIWQIFEFGARIKTDLAPTSGICGGFHLHSKWNFEQWMETEAIASHRYCAFIDGLLMKLQSSLQKLIMTLHYSPLFIIFYTHSHLGEYRIGVKVQLKLN